jgi:hypothetical protein
MTRLIAVVFVLLIPCASSAQERRIPVSVSRTGQDQVGSLFAAALKRELSHSKQYEPMFTGGINTGFRLYVDLITVDVADKELEQGKRSVVSIVIQDFGLPNSYPVANMWYHKVVVVDKNAVGEIAKDLLEDMNARWCNYIKNSVVGCPKEKLYPQIENVGRSTPD